MINLDLISTLGKSIVFVFATVENEHDILGTQQGFSAPFLRWYLGKQLLVDCLNLLAIVYQDMTQGQLSGV